MANNPQFSTTLRNDWLTDIVTRAGAGAVVELRSATAASCAAGDNGTLLGTLALSNPIGTVSGGVLTFSTITDDSSADASATAVQYRVKTSGGTVVHQGTVGTSGCDLNLLNNVLVAGQPISVTSFTITAPGA